jgi:anti-sigma regulatory factor (Ser/Thr protein kinase)
MRGELFRTSLPRDPSCGSVTRRLLEANLVRHLDRALDDAKTVASELVDNAYVHGEGRIELRVCAKGKHVRIEVIDQGQNSHLVAVQSEGSDSRGLAVVEQLASRWGAREGTTHVWAELRIPPATDPAG